MSSENKSRNVLLKPKFKKRDSTIVRYRPRAHALLKNYFLLLLEMVISNFMSGWIRNTTITMHDSANLAMLSSVPVSER